MGDVFDVLFNILCEITNIVYVFTPLVHCSGESVVIIESILHRVVVLHIIVSAVEDTILKCII